MNEYKGRCTITQAQWLAAFEANSGRFLFAGKSGGPRVQILLARSLFELRIDDLLPCGAAVVEAIFFVLR